MVESGEVCVDVLPFKRCLEAGAHLIKTQLNRRREMSLPAALAPHAQRRSGVVVTLLSAREGGEIVRFEKLQQQLLWDLEIEM